MFFSALGNLVEYYDFYIYSFTAIYFAGRFFPNGDQTAQLLSAAAVFAGGFLMRPLGGWFFGRFADRHGRKSSLILSVIMMSVGSGMVAILPTYDSIGWVASLLLLVARLIQGLSLGGEYGATATYISEVATPGKRGFYGSFQYVTLIGGQLTALLVLIPLQLLLTDEQLREWGWRAPFAIGGVLAVIALFLRTSMRETFVADEAAVRADPAVREAGTMKALGRHWPAVVLIFTLTAGGSLSFYTFTTYMQKYLVNTAGLPAKAVSGLMTGALFLFMVLQPAFGALSDRIGRRNQLLIFGALTTACTVPLLTALGAAATIQTAFLLLMASLLMMSFYTSISGVFKAELFPAHVRALGVGVTFGVANALFGGSAEYIALLCKSIGHEVWFYWYVTVVCGVSLISAVVLRRFAPLQKFAVE